MGARLDGHREIPGSLRRRRSNPPARERRWKKRAGVPRVRQGLARRRASSDPQYPAHRRVVMDHAHRRMRFKENNELARSVVPANLQQNGPAICTKGVSKFSETLLLLGRPTGSARIGGLWAKACSRWSGPGGRHVVPPPDQQGQPRSHTAPLGTPFPLWPPLKGKGPPRRAARFCINLSF